MGDQDGAALEGGREHFGYADGFAQPSIEGSGVDPLPGEGAPPARTDGWRPLRAGEFVLGYPDEQDALARRAARPTQLGVNGSYLVYRKLLRTSRASAARCADSGRATTRAARSCWPPRSSAAGATARHSTCRPTGPIPTLVGDVPRNNAFSSADDPDGLRCPVGSHIRRTNPRHEPPVRRQARQPPPPDPARDYLRPPLPEGARTTAPSAA